MDGEWYAQQLCGPLAGRGLKIARSNTFVFDPTPIKVSRSLIEGV